MEGQDRANPGHTSTADVDVNGAVLVRFAPSGGGGSIVDQGASNAGVDPWPVTDSGLAALAALTDGTQLCPLQSSAKGGSGAAPVTSTANGADHQGLDVAEQFAPAYEDNAAARALVEQRNNFVNIASAATTNVKNSAGFLHRIQVNKGVPSATITLYDSLTATGTKIGTLTFGSTLLTDFPTAEFDVSFTTGLTIVTSGATDITVSYR